MRADGAAITVFVDISGRVWHNSRDGAETGKKNLRLLSEYGIVDWKTVGKEYLVGEGTA